MAIQYYEFSEIGTAKGSVEIGFKYDDQTLAVEFLVIESTYDKSVSVEIGVVGFIEETLNIPARSRFELPLDQYAFPPLVKDAEGYPKIPDGIAVYLRKRSHAAAGI